MRLTGIPDTGFLSSPGIGKAVLFVEADSAKIVLVDEKVESLRRETLGLIEQDNATSEPQCSGATTIWSR